MNVDWNVVTASTVALLGAVGTFIAVVRRRNGSADSTTNDSDVTLKRVFSIVEHLQKENERKDRRIAALEAKIETLEAKIATLMGRL